MVSALLPANETDRLEALRSFQILDTSHEKEYDEIVALASQICGTDMSLISLIDHNRQWFKAKKGVEASETSRDIAFCAHAILNSELMEIPDAHQDERFNDNPLVVNEPNIRFYAGMPLETRDGFRLGTLCVLDTVPKQLNAGQKFALQALANQVIKLFELRFQNQALRDSVNLRNKLISVIAHDVKGPLKSIGMLTEFLTPDQMSDEELKDAVDEIKTVSTRTSELVENILAWARKQNDRKSIKLSSHDLRPIISDIEQLYHPQLKMKKLNLKLNLALETAFTDEEILRFILRNLISNAIKFSENADILVSTQSIDQNEWQFSVEDKGTGMTEEQQKKLFSWDHRYTSPGTMKEKGTGLGLLLVQEMVQKLNGELAISSKPGQGTKITINFKIARG